MTATRDGHGQDEHDGRRKDPVTVESYRDACLLLVGVIERQQSAMNLQLLAGRELSEAVKEASGIISTLLVGDPSAALSLPSTHTESGSTSDSEASPAEGDECES